MPDTEQIDEEVKIGREISARNAKRIQDAHDVLAELGAACRVAPEVEQLPILSLPDDTLVTFGREVKALGDGKIGGYLVTFTNANDPDATGDYFDKDTDFGEVGQSPVYYHHGLDAKMGKRKLSKAELRQDEWGIWAETQLAMREEYEKLIYKMVEDGKLGWSSGTAPHLVEREMVGKSFHIKSWPLGLDASLTPTPAEFRNSVISLKSLLPAPGTNVEVPAAAEPTGEPQTVGDTVTASDGEVKAASPIASKLPNKDNTMDNSPDTQKIVSDAVEQALKAFADKLPTNGTGGVSVVKDEADQPWESLGQFYKAVAYASSKRYEPDIRLSAVKAPTGAGEYVPSDGGYLVPNQFASGLLENLHGSGNILPLVRHIPITGNALTLNAVDETSRVDGSRWGGLRGYWLEEADSITSSKPKFRQINFKLKKVAALVYVTDELLNDQNALQGFMGAAVPDELRFKVEDAIINGNGVGKPQGVLNANALVSFVRDTATLVTYPDIANMWARRAPWYNDYVWLVNSDVLPALNQLVLASSTEIPLRFMDYGQDGMLRMMGRPVIETEHCQTYKDQGDIILISPSQYAVVENGGIQAAQSIHVNFIYDESVFRFTYRVDGNPLWSSALTPMHGSATVSPFVVLTSATT